MAEERMMLDKVESETQAKTSVPVLMESTGPVVAKMDLEVEKEAVSFFPYSSSKSVIVSQSFYFFTNHPMPFFIIGN